jgi:hypothetical protein
MANPYENTPSGSNLYVPPELEKRRPYVEKPQDEGKDWE